MGSSKAKVLVPVSKRALVQRINRRLRKQPSAAVMSATRGGQARQQLGEFYAMDLQRFIYETHIDIEKFGRKLGVLQPYERLEEDPDA